MDALAPGHLIILVAIIALIYGSKRLPEMGRGIGEGLREFQRGLRGSDPHTPAGDDTPPADPRAGVGRDPSDPPTEAASTATEHRAS